MIRPFACLVALSFLSLPCLDAEEKKKRKRKAPVISPTIHDNGNVTFRIEAPNAEQVTVSGEMIQGKPAIMTKGDDGIWSVTVESIEPGLYGYSMNVDGLKMLDPGNPSNKPMRSPKTSILHLPGDSVFDFKDVPHGTVHLHGYHSKPINRYREIRVYTPPGYETGKEEYPLLVLQHGHSDKGETWTAYGKAHWILDNLIAEGKARPMIVLMADGHPIPESFGNGRSNENTEELRADLMDAAIPMVEELYRVKPGRMNRAIAGLSMGGLHALTIGLNEMDTFATIGAFSAAVPDNEAIATAIDSPEKTNDQLKLLWIAIGENDFLLEENERLTGTLDAAGIRYDWTLTSGGHSWPVWRDYLSKFAPLLFQ